MVNIYPGSLLRHGTNVLTFPSKGQGFFRYFPSSCRPMFSRPFSVLLSSCGMGQSNAICDSAAPSHQSSPRDWTTGARPGRRAVRLRWDSWPCSARFFITNAAQFAPLHRAEVGQPALRRWDRIMLIIFLSSHFPFISPPPRWDRNVVATCHLCSSWLHSRRSAGCLYSL